MIANCTCGTSVEVKLDLNTDEVICQNEVGGKVCGRVVEISSFMKGAMRSSGDVIRDTKPKIPFGGMLSVCQKCGKEFSAELDRKTHKCHCPKCKTEFKISNLFKERLLQYKIFVGQSATLVEKDATKDEEDLGEVAPARQVKTASVESDDDSGDDEDIKKMFGESSIEKPKAVNKLKERALKEKGLLKKPTFKRITTDSNGDPIGGKALFHPESEESDAQLVADLEGRPKSPAFSKDKKAAKPSKKVKNK
jgi:DNA-directed RNA polymerase subunit RPC12/RpoP